MELTEAQRERLRHPFKVEVTAEHIRIGVRGSCSMCPAALAVRDWLGDNISDEPGLIGVEVDADNLTITEYAEPDAFRYFNWRYIHDGSEFIMTFDRDGSMRDVLKPFILDILPVDYDPGD